MIAILAMFQIKITELIGTILKNEFLIASKAILPKKKAPAKNNRCS
jgi:hypothetical protein